MTLGADYPKQGIPKFRLRLLRNPPRIAIVVALQHPHQDAFFWPAPPSVAVTFYLSPRLNSK